MREGVGIDKLIEIQNTPEYQEKVQALREYLLREGKRIQEQFGLETTENMRVAQTTQFPYPAAEIATDAALALAKKLRFKHLDQEDGEAPELRAYSEQFEMLKTAIFNKNFGDKYIVVRTSLHDDQENGVDNLLVNIHTGKPICALDEVSSASPRRIAEKQRSVLDKNNQGGSRLKYGVTLPPGKKEGKKVILGPQEDIPTFYLWLEKDLVRRGVETFDPNSTISEGLEGQIYELMLKALSLEAATLKTMLAAGPTKVHENIKKGLRVLDRVVGEKLAELRRPGVEEEE